LSTTVIPYSCYVSHEERLSIEHLAKVFVIHGLKENWADIVRDNLLLDKVERESIWDETTKLPCGDVLFPFYNSLSEIKIGTDVSDRERLQDECMRLAHNRIKHPEMTCHLYYCNTDYEISFDYLMEVMGYCNHYGINLHFAPNPTAMVKQMKRHLEKYFHPRFFVKKSNLPSVCARMLAQIPGVSDKKAWEWSNLLKHRLSNLWLYDLDAQLRAIFGMKKDNSEMLSICYKIDEGFEWGFE